jgi:hypothetical protein
MELDAPPERLPPSPWAAAAVTLCGVCAFLEIYCTQPLLPLLTRLFRACKTGAGMTVSAATLGLCRRRRQMNPGSGKANQIKVQAHGEKPPGDFPP